MLFNFELKFLGAFESFSHFSTTFGGKNLICVLHKEFLRAYS